MEYPRELAIRVLTRVLSDRSPLDEAIDIEAAKLKSDERGWVLEICAGTLRWKGRIDLAIDSIAIKKKPTGWLRKALSVTAYQLIAQERTPAGRVVSETVDQIKSREGIAPAQFANALLRKVADHAAQWRSPQYPKNRSITDQSRWASLPEWMWKKLLSERGEEWARAYAEASLIRPEVWIKGRPGAATLEGAEPGPVPGSFRLTASRSVTTLPGFNEGEFIVQDISGQILVEEILRETRASMGREKIQALDLCAAPGGKSIALAWGGAEVVATDLGQARIALLQNSIERTRLKDQIRVIGRDEVQSLDLQDLVWVDAPCTGTGILRRHPDVRWLRQEKDLAALLETQRKLLKDAWSKVRPGGCLAYTVCSVLKEEGEMACKDAALSGARLLREWSLSPTESPHGDGFFGVLLSKSE